MILANPPHLPLPSSSSSPSSLSVDSDIDWGSYDEGGSFLKAILLDYSRRLAPGGRLLLVYSDLAQALGMLGTIWAETPFPFLRLTCEPAVK